MKKCLNDKTILMVVTSWDRLGDTGRSTGLWLEEFTTPYYCFKNAGYDVIVASPKGGHVPIDPESLKPEASSESTIRFIESGDDVLETSKTINECLNLELCAIFYPGGHGPMWDLSHDRDNAQLLGKNYHEGKLIGAVCHGPAAFVSTKDCCCGEPIIKDKNLTGFSNSEENLVNLNKVVPFLLESRLKELGAHYTKGDNWTSYHVVDGNLITGQNPQSALATANAMIEWLKAH